MRPMPLVPCRRCRRHVRAEAPCCPFCGGAKSPGRAEVSGAGLSRGAMAAIASAGAAVVFEVSACAVYGGPPQRVLPPRAPTHYLDVPRDEALPEDEARASLIRRARAAGCAAEEHREGRVAVRCGDHYFAAYPGEAAWSLRCVAADQAGCRPAFEAILAVPDPAPPPDAGASAP